MQIAYEVVHSWPLDKNSVFEPKAIKGYRGMTYCGCGEAGVITV